MHSLILAFFFASHALAHMFSNPLNRVSIYAPLKGNVKHVHWTYGSRQIFCLRFNDIAWTRPQYKSFRVFLYPTFSSQRQSRSQLTDVRINRVKITDRSEFAKDCRKYLGYANDVLMVSGTVPYLDDAHDVEIVLKPASKLSSFFRLGRKLAIASEVETKYGKKTVVVTEKSDRYNFQIENKAEDKSAKIDQQNSGKWNGVEENSFDQFHGGENGSETSDDEESVYDETEVLLPNNEDAENEDLLNDSSASEEVDVPGDHSIDDSQAVDDPSQQTDLFNDQKENFIEQHHDTKAAYDPDTKRGNFGYLSRKAYDGTLLGQFGHLLEERRDSSNAHDGTLLGHLLEERRDSSNAHDGTLRGQFRHLLEERRDSQAAHDATSAHGFQPSFYQPQDQQSIDGQDYNMQNDDDVQDVQDYYLNYDDGQGGQDYYDGGQDYYDDSQQMMDPNAFDAGW